MWSTFVVSVFLFVLLNGAEIDVTDSATDETITTLSDSCDENCEVNSTSVYDSSTEENTTDISLNFTEDISSVETITTSTVTQETTSTQEPRVSTPEGEIKNVFPEGPDQCECDLLSTVCEVNCCCDSDCKSADKSVFSHCTDYKEDFPPTNGLCYSSDNVFKSNSPYKVLAEEWGMFCIARDNFPDRLVHSAPKVITTAKTFEKIWKRSKNSYSWTLAPTGQHFDFSNKTHYKYGSPLWSYVNATEAYLVAEVPGPIASSFCDGFKTLAFLQDFQSKCLRRVPSSSEECKRRRSKFHALETWNIIASPVTLNGSESNIDVNRLKVKFLLCGREGICKNITALPSPEGKSSSCNNLIQNLHCTFIHNGTQGLKDMNCIVQLQNISLTEEFYYESIQIIYKWDETNRTEFFTRSGRPGYIDSKPVISGSKINEHVHVPNDPNEWLTLPSSSPDGGCSSERRNLLFNVNMRAQCSLSFPRENLQTLKGCSDLQSMILRELLGNIQLNDSKALNTYISSFGDPTDEKTTEWVPIFIEGLATDQLPCKSLISSVSMNVMYSLVGPVSNPQAKIIGAAIKTMSFPVQCVKSVCSLNLVSSVVYTDLSLTPVKRYSRPPMIRITLPNDFFYPFLSSRGFSSKLITPLWSCVIILRFLLFFY